MGLTWKFRDKQKTEKAIKRNKEYLKHYKAAKAAKGTPMTYAEYQKHGKEYQYYKLPNLRKSSVEAQLRESGVSEEDIRSLLGKGKKKK